MPTPFLIDTDTASDDAVAIIMALRDPSIDVKALTIVAGNVPAPQAAQNALYTAQLCNRPDLPVHIGLHQPLLRPYENAQWFHGQDGLGDMNYPRAQRPPESEHAVDALIRIILATPGITLVTLGPLSNIAAALIKNPSITHNVSRLVIMGGNPCCEGNVTPAAEYNIWVDPEAAQIVFRAPWPIDMVGWHLCRNEAIITPTEIARLQTMGDLGNFVVDANRTAAQAIREQTGEIGISLPDPTAMAVALNPSIITSASPHHVAIATDNDLTRGMTVIDRLNVANDPRNHPTWQNTRPANIIWQINTSQFKEMLFASLRP
jgi:purine nucleosidase